jgi:hypothetical protein
MTCKLEFLKASGYWTSGKKHEVVGSINNSKGTFRGGFYNLQLYGYKEICIENMNHTGTFA